MTTITQIIERPTQAQIYFNAFGPATTELAHGQVLVRRFDPSRPDDGTWYEIQRERNFHLDFEHDVFEMQGWFIWENYEPFLQEAVVYEDDYHQDYHQDYLPLLNGELQ